MVFVGYKYTLANFVFTHRMIHKSTDLSGSEADLVPADFDSLFALVCPHLDLYFSLAWSHFWACYC